MPTSITSMGHSGSPNVPLKSTFDRQRSDFTFYPFILPHHPVLLTTSQFYILQLDESQALCNFPSQFWAFLMKFTSHSSTPWNTTMSPFKWGQTVHHNEGCFQWQSPHQTSSQNKIEVPSPSFHSPEGTHPNPTLEHSINILQVGLLTIWMSSHTAIVIHPKSENNHLPHKLPFSTKNHHFHLASRTSLKIQMNLIPKPAFTNGLWTKNKLTM